MIDKEKREQQSGGGSNIQTHAPIWVRLFASQKPEVAGEQEESDSNHKAHYGEYVIWLLIAFGFTSLIFVRPEREYLDNHSGMVSAIGTIAIMLLTIAYVRYSRRQWHTMEGQMAEMQKRRREVADSSERQLRAYVVCDNGTIFNVANPVAVFLGQIFNPPSEAEITNPAFGPGYKLQIKNAGQTPAYEVRHWSNILFKEFPLKSDLPARDPTITPTACVLGPGISSTKFNYLIKPLTAQQVSDLRDGTGAVYVYGDITYRDTFGRSWDTHYRLMHHATGGAIGVSTDLSFCESGNEAT
jgi:hypothetical protein